MYVEGYQKYLSEPYWRQIALQIRDLSRVYLEEAPRKIPEGNVNHTTYDTLCTNPQGFLEAVCERLEKLGVGSMTPQGPVPNGFPRGGASVDPKTRADLRYGLQEVMHTEDLHTDDPSRR
jgi:hypothetical protein